MVGQENYQDAIQFFQGLRDRGPSQLSGSVLVEFELQSRWATGKAAK